MPDQGDIQASAFTKTKKTGKEGSDFYISFLPWIGEHIVQTFIQMVRVLKKEILLFFWKE